MRLSQNRYLNNT